VLGQISHNFRFITTMRDPTAAVSPWRSNWIAGISSHSTSAAYGPDLAPCDFFCFFLFPRLTELLKSIKFNSDEEIKAEVKRRFDAQTEEFYLDGISQLVERWPKCIAPQKAVMSKNMILLLYVCFRFIILQCNSSKVT